MRLRMTGCNAMSAFTIAECRRDDLVRIAEVERQCFPDEALPLLSFIHYFQLFRETFLVAWGEEGRVVGFIVAGAGAASPEDAWVLSVAVLPSTQRAGVAAALASALRDRLLAAGVRRVYATVAAGNRASLELCTGMGMVLHSRVENYLAPGDERLVLCATF